MKRLIFSCFFLLSIFIINGQNYYNFPVSNTIWNIYLHNVWYNTNTETTRYTFTSEDTVINNQIYSKLFSIEDDTIMNQSNSEYFAAFREDSTKRVYFILNNDTNEILLYDFSLDIGDSIHYNYRFYEGVLFEQNNHYKVLESIDSININGSFRKKFTFSGSYPGITWVEGIGAIDGEGLFAPIAHILTGGEVYHLACVKDSNTIVYLNNPICAKCFCSILTNIGMLVFKKEINVYPNPTDRAFKIDFSGIDGTVLRLYTNDLKLVKEFEIVDEKQIIVNQKLSKGLYFLVINDKLDNHYVKKIVIK
ncbi:MAG: T9SS type A sorting domain-containing protein [Bacteroidales bacterium]|nr:T9SS type A sorting domain-containing protein [Bacteroidales bacterium]